MVENDGKPTDYYVGLRNIDMLLKGEEVLALKMVVLMSV
jgi:hypothetical protein